MRLTQIKLAGFKSFVDPTVISTPSELVGVVGPNGCGKSNIIDAVRWVLGETRASELRGASMQDVIFNGSDQRKPAARASVELVFDNSAGRAAGQWAAFTEIAVRRVLTRDGASSFTVNNQPVRRRDVHDIFLGTGLGTRGYAIIGQGMINRLIEARPDELRVYLEEAAGVSRYKERRRETAARLADARGNLARLDDILAEMTSQLRRLEGQAAVASRWRALQAEAGLKRHGLWLQQEQAARAEQVALATQTMQAQTDLEAAIARLRALESDLEARRVAHAQAGERAQQAQGLLFEAGAAVSRLETEIRHVTESRARLLSRRRQLQDQLREWEAQREEGQAAGARALADLDGAQEQAQQAGQALADVRAGLPALEVQWRALADERERARRGLAEAEQQRAVLAQSLADAAERGQMLEDQHVRLAAEAAELAASDPGVLARLEDACDQTGVRLEQARAELAELDAQQTTLGARREDAQRLSQAAQAAVERLDARREALVALQDRIQSADACGPWLEQQGFDGLAPLWQQLQVEPGWEPAVEAVLHECLQALALQDLDQAGAFAQGLPPARLAFYQVPAGAMPAVGPTPAGARPLLDRVRADATLQPILQFWLRDVYQIEDLAQALARRAELPEGGVWILPAGHRVDACTVRFHGADTEQAGLLARRQQIADLARALATARQGADEAQAARTRADEDHRALLARRGPARQAVEAALQAQHEARLQRDRAQHARTQAEQRAGKVAAELRELQTRQAALAQRRDEAQGRLAALDQRLPAWRQQGADAEQRGAALSQELERVRTQVSERERAAQEADFAVRALRQRQEDLQRTLAQAEEQGRRSGAELAALQDELGGLDDGAAQTQLQQALAVRQECEAGLRAARVTQDDCAAGLRQTDEARLGLERGLEPLRARITQLQLQEQAARLAAEQFAAQLDEHRVDRAALQRELAAQPVQWQQLQWLQSEIRRLESQVEALGAVNLAALDELAAARERRAFLDAQHEDLLAAIETLENAIRTIDRETRALLSETFEAVNRNFGELFPQLFGGGEARLVLSGNEILDAGVEVLAQPPGKRNTSIQLLSGGEKALTATALIFALFRLNPAPFCLLDEVDAPLDDANTERYANLVRRMSERTQFLFISHNKIAMQIARQLVGVTMQEQGVSRVVAVDMDAALQWAQAAA